MHSIAAKRASARYRISLFVLLILATALPLPVYAQEPPAEPREYQDTGYRDIVSFLESPDAQELLAAPAAAETPVNAGAADAIDWLEPRGLSIVDLVGVVPEEHLRGSILVFTGGSGILRYLEGRRDGNRVTIKVDVSPRYPELSVPYTTLNCLGKRALYDEWPLTVPASTMRIFQNGRDISAEVSSTFHYYRAGQMQPSNDARETRYKAYETPFVALERTADGALKIPANMGCTIYIPGERSGLTAEFVFTAPQQIAVDVLGSQTFTFHSYIGTGDRGRIAALVSQMQSRFGSRHEKFPLQIPAGADYVWLHYPPTPVSAYSNPDANVDKNIRLPGSGTYRLSSNGGLSVDHTISQGLPLHAQWLDSDMGGGDYLHQLGPVNILAAPEYFVPAGVPYHPCMKDGGCSSELLDRIYKTPMQMTLYYYRVRRLAGSNLTSIPLRQVGRSWDAAAAAAIAAPQPEAEAADAGAADRTVVALLPLIMTSPAPKTLPDDAPRSEDPWGWFDADGRMLDVIPGF